jgi:cytoskeletal protein CcmA (bactofilin family)
MVVVGLLVYAFYSTDIGSLLRGWTAKTEYVDSLDQEFDELGEDFENELTEEYLDEPAEQVSELPVVEEEIVVADVIPKATPQPAPASVPPTQPVQGHAPQPHLEPRRRRRAVMGPKISFKGELVGEEDLLIQGNVEGVVYLKGHNLTIGDGAIVRADILAKNVIVEGDVTGDVIGQERIIMRSTSNVRGNVVAERITMDDGAKIRGGIDMEAESQQSAADQLSSRVTSRPATYYSREGKASPVMSVADVRTSMIEGQRAPARREQPRSAGASPEPKFGEPGFVDRRAVPRGKAPASPKPQATATPPVNPPSSPQGEVASREPKFGEPGFVDRREVKRGTSTPQPPVKPASPEVKAPVAPQVSATPSKSPADESSKDAADSGARVIRPVAEDGKPADSE